MLVSKTDTTMSLSKLTSFITFFTASSNSLVLFNTWNTTVSRCSVPVQLMQSQCICIQDISVHTQSTKKYIHTIKTRNTAVVIKPCSPQIDPLALDYKGKQTLLCLEPKKRQYKKVSMKCEGTAVVLLQPTPNSIPTALQSFHKQKSLQTEPEINGHEKEF